MLPKYPLHFQFQTQWGEILPHCPLLGVLVLAKKDGHISAVRHMADTLVTSGYFLAGKVIEDALRLSGEE